MIELKNIEKKFNAGTVNETTVFTNFNFSVNTGEFVSVIGSNGSGKSTLLNLIAGSILPDSGAVLLDGNDITFKPKDNTFYAQLLPTFSFSKCTDLPLARKKT